MVGDSQELEPKPLVGVTVVEFGQYIAAPGTATVLADLGATVVKVEPLGGESARRMGPYGRAIFDAYNRRKSFVTIDLRSPDGAAAARELVGSADVIIQNLRPGALEEFGLDAESTLRANPRCIYLNISGFGVGPTGSQLAGLDIVAQAESGMMSINGERGGDPLRVGYPVIDTALPYVGATAILSALLRRSTSGRGAILDTSLLEVGMALQTPIWTGYLVDGDEPTRVGNGQATVAPAADLVKTVDGHMILSAYTEAHWTALCRTIGRPELANDPRFADIAARVANRSDLQAELDATLGKMSAKDGVKLLRDAGLVAGVVRSYSSAKHSAEVAELGILVDVHRPSGETYQTVRLPFRDRTTSKYHTKGGPKPPGADNAGILPKTIAG